jgi:hypothetical protein
MASLCARTAEPFIHSRWSETFHLRRSDNGDTISIEGVFAAAETLYVYDMAGGAIVAFDTTGKIVARTPLASFGRGTYAGDDFVVRKGEALFLNTVDKRIEIYDLRTGGRVRSVPYPLDLFAFEPRRIRRVITRIFLDRGRIVLGNAWHYVVFDIELGKKAAGAEVESVGAGRRLEALHEGERIVVSAGKLHVGGLAGGDTVRTHFPVPGKRYVVFNGRLYSLVLSARGMAIVEVGVR